MPGINHHVEQKRRERVTLTDPTEGGEVGPNVTVDVHSGPATGDKLHDASHPTVVKAFAKQHFPQEGPVDRVVRFVEV